MAGFSPSETFVHALIIEDEVLLALAVETALADLGYATFAIAATKPQAIEAAEKQCPDLIIADHRIIDGTGTEAVQAICSERAIPVVFVTGSAGEVREQLPDALIIPKPFSIPDLQAAIDTALERPFQHSPE